MINWPSLGLYSLNVFTSLAWLYQYSVCVCTCVFVFVRCSGDFLSFFLWNVFIQLLYMPLHVPTQTHVQTHKHTSALTVITHVASMYTLHVHVHKTCTEECIFNQECRLIDLWRFLVEFTIRHCYMAVLTIMLLSTYWNWYMYGFVY